MDVEWLGYARALLIWVHLGAMICAAIAIAFGDVALLRGHAIDTGLLAVSARWVAVGLALLWITGLAVATIDTRWQLSALASRPKLLAKLAVVTALTINGAVLHRTVFPLLGQACAHPAQVATRAAVLGAFSAVSWSYAMFLGVATAFAPLLGIDGFMALYAAALLAGAGVSMRGVRSRLLASLVTSQAPSTPA